MATKKEPGTALAPWQQELADMAQQQMDTAAAAAIGTGPKITFGPTGVRLNKNEPVRSIKVLVLAHQFYREYFDTPFVEGNPTGPKCYSYDGVKPHPDAHEKQDNGAGCNKCPLNEFDSNTNGRGGKACVEGARMALLGLDSLKDISKAEPIIARVSMLNRKVLSNYRGANSNPATVTEIISNPVKGSSIGYDLVMNAVGTAPLNGTTGPEVLRLAKQAVAKFNEPMPAYKEAEKSKRVSKRK